MNAITVTSYANAKSARAAARKALGPDAEVDLHYTVSAVAGDNATERFVWAEVEAKAAEVVQAAPAAKDESIPAHALALHALANRTIAAFAADLQAESDAERRAKADRRATPPVDAELAEQAAVLADAAHEIEQVANRVANNVMNFAVQQASAAPVVEKKPKSEPKPQGERVMQNGVRRPGPGLCLDVWEACDAHMAANSGAAPDSKAVKGMADKHGWNANNASIEFYQWRKFNGITGRAAKVVPETPVAQATSTEPAPAAQA